MKCTKCKHEVSPDAKFCPACGTPSDSKAANRETLKGAIREVLEESGVIQKPETEEEKAARLEAEAEEGKDDDDFFGIS